jgi:hypothetical protein
LTAKDQRYEYGCTPQFGVDNGLVQVQTVFLPGVTGSHLFILEEELMKTNSSSLILTLCLACGVMQAQANSADRKCPVVINRVELSYNHQGEPSKPQLRLWFQSDAGSPISAIAFSLSILDSGGYPRSYPGQLTYSDGLDAGKKKVFIWDLASESVDIHRTGETVVVQKVEFADAASWIDDGSEACAFKIDFHAR